MDASLRRQTLSDTLRRSAQRVPNRLGLACGATRWSYAELNGVSRKTGRGPRLARDQARRQGRGAGAQFARIRGAALCADAARRDHGSDQFHAARRRRRLHSQPLRRAHARLRQRHGGGRAEGRRARAACRRIPLAAVRGGERAGRRHDEFLALIEAGGEPPGDGPESFDVAQIVYTSGTESRPKGVQLTHDAILWQYVSCMIDASISGDDVAVHALPLYHCAQLDVFLGPSIYAGGVNIVTAKPARTTSSASSSASARPRSSRRRPCGSRCCARPTSTPPTCRACARAITAPRSCRSR